MNTFQNFYQGIGLKSYPFRDRTAEKEDTKKLFIQPLDYSLLEDVLNTKQSAIISGNRGTGKTIMLDDLMSKITSDRLMCLINHFDTISLANNLLDFYSLLLQSLTQKILINLSQNKRKIKKLSSDDKVFLSFLIMKYGDSITDNQLVNQIETVQLNLFKRIINKFSLPISYLLNYSATAFTNFGNEFLTKTFGSYLPTINEKEIRKIFPDIKFNITNEFKSVEISYSLLEKSLQLIKNMFGQPPIIFVDKLDEDLRLENDAQLISSFIRDLVCDSKILLNSDIQLFISVWQIPFTSLSTVFRRSKHYVYDIKWNTQQLIIVLNRRLKVYSNGYITRYEDMFADDVSSDVFNSIFELSNSNPRDLWDILDNIFNAQYQIDSTSKVIQKQSIQLGLQQFVQNFSFYEYYPKKKDAQKNTNDVYSYIHHLLTLKDTDEFTNNELRISANTGGSTSNYITGMVNLGLVYKTDTKRPGGAVIYKINDPKVKYAIKYNLDINQI